MIWWRCLTKKENWMLNLYWLFSNAMQKILLFMVGDRHWLLWIRFAFFKGFSIWSRDPVPPSSSGCSWWSLPWQARPSLPATSSATGRASAPSQAWRNRELCITFARPPIRTRKVFQRKHANWQISLRTSDIVTPAKYTVDMFSAHSWRSLCKDWHLFPPQFNHQPYLWRWI